jgi:hypothetical protein
MTFEEFLKDLKDKEFYCEPYSYEESYHDKEKTKPPMLYIKWRSGGQSGGSCWDEVESRHYPIDADEEPNFDELDRLFEIYFSNITMLKYKNFYSHNIKSDDDSCNEYYGNYSNYTINFVEIKSIYDFLVAEGKLSD